MNLSSTQNVLLMEQARNSLKDKWGLVIGAVVINSLVGMIVLIPMIGWIASIIICPVVYIGFLTFILSVSRGKEAKIDQLFEPLNNGSLFGTAIAATLLQCVFIFLGFLCLIVPGIILAFSFQMTMFIISDDNKIGPFDAIKKSYYMMNGNKWKYFCMMCRFIGWYFLSLLTLGVGFLWLIPYVHMSNAKFYDDISKGQKSIENDEENVTPAEVIE